MCVFSCAELRCSGNDWHEFGEFCYKPFTEKKTWHEAQTECRKHGADLVSIMSLTEQSWLESYLYLGMEGIEEGRKNEGGDDGYIIGGVPLLLSIFLMEQLVLFALRYGCVLVPCETTEVHKTVCV